MEKGKTGKVRMANNFETDSDEKFHLTLREAILKAFDKATDKAVDGLMKKGTSVVKKQKKIYFAGPWFDKRSKELYETCEKIQRMCDLISPYKVYFPSEEYNETPYSAFVSNISNLRDADLVIALVSKKDCGTSWEIGMSYALGKHIVLLGYDETTFLSHTNVMLAFSGVCVTIKELANILCDDSFFRIKIKDEWEGIE